MLNLLKRLTAGIIGLSHGGLAPLSEQYEFEELVSSRVEQKYSGVLQSLMRWKDEVSERLGS